MAKLQGTSRFILPPTLWLSLLPSSREPSTANPQHVHLAAPGAAPASLLPWDGHRNSQQRPALPACPGCLGRFCLGERLPGSALVQGSVLLPTPSKMSHLSAHRATREQRPATFLSWREGRSCVCVHVEIWNHCLSINPGSIYKHTANSLSN